MSVGRIELIIGPMFAGKTTELMRRIRREIYARRSCFVIKYVKDTRYSAEAVASHDQAKLKVHAAVSRLCDVGDTWEQFDVIGIDEGQFFPDLLPFASRAADAGKTVIVSALDGDYRRQPFGQVCSLVPYCETIDKLTAVCMVCHKCPGSFTRRTINSDEQELIGGAEMYVAACRDCFAGHREISASAVQQYKASMKMVETSFFSSSSPSISGRSSTSEGEVAAVKRSRTDDAAKDSEQQVATRVRTEA
eukprot:gene10067-7037_t